MMEFVIDNLGLNLILVLETETFRQIRHLQFQGWDLTFVILGQDLTLTFLKQNIILTISGQDWTANFRARFDI